MTIHAYQEIYLSNAQSMLGDTFDYAMNACNMEGKDFVNLFLVSSISRRIERGEAAILAGKSGAEIVHEIIYETKGEKIPYTHYERLDRSIEYWIGWAIAYYQWYTDRQYREIFKIVSYHDLEKMYFPIHEADITKFVDLMDAKIGETFPDTNLKRIRQLYNCTQAELASLAGVSLRSIQMYEQRNKNINKASAETLYRLSKVLGCNIEDLLEKNMM